MTEPKPPMTPLKWIAMAYATAAVMLLALLYQRVNYGTIAKASSGAVAADIRLRMVVLEEVGATVGLMMVIGLPVILGIWVWRLAWRRIEARHAIEKMNGADEGSVAEPREIN